MSDIKDRSYPFLRGYEALLWEYGLKLDVVDGKLRVVDLGANYPSKISVYRYLQELTELVENDIIV